MGELERKERLQKMTLEEKASLCAGRDFWHTKGIEHLEIPQMMLCDGPHGLRKQVHAVDHLGISDSNPAICFPAGCALAASFDPGLAEQMGTELGTLAKAEEVSVVLGPAMNIKRSPLCGRNFEYFSEDPKLSAAIGTGVVNGIQSCSVGASPKHFAANNQEYYRQTSNSVMDEATMREIYLASFEEMVKEAKPWTMMCSYNRVNGTYACENKKLLQDILRDEWGFDGIVMTDWGACDDPVESLLAGLDLEMPGPSQDNVDAISKAVKQGEVKEEVLDQTVERLLLLAERVKAKEKEASRYDFEQGHSIAKKIETECAVLLKNEDAILPLQEEEKIAVIGAYAKNPRFQGGGSSHIHPYQVDSFMEACKENHNITYADGFDTITGEVFLEQARKAAQNAGKAILFVGLPDEWETEGVDRERLDLPEYQNLLIEEVAKVQPNTVVVLHNGSPVTMPWVKQVKGILELYLGGEAVGSATADLLYGRANPSGRLAETFPLRLEDTPTYPFYGVEREDVRYREEQFVGYRYYETMKKPVLFPFGYGLSYTDFSYSDLRVDKKEISDTQTVEVSVDVTNIGKRVGKEVVQLYVEGTREGQVRSLRELKAFTKIELAPGEKKTVTFSLDRRAFATWNVSLHDWYVESGCYTIAIGKSASDMVLTTKLSVTSEQIVGKVFTINSPIGDFLTHPRGKRIQAELNAIITGGKKTEAQPALSAKALSLGAAMMPLRALISLRPNVTREQLEELVRRVNE